jgi:hypothetical protein
MMFSPIVMRLPKSSLMKVRAINKVGKIAILNSDFRCRKFIFSTHLGGGVFIFYFACFMQSL